MDYPNVPRIVNKPIDRGLRSDYVFELTSEFTKYSWVQYCKVISKECVDYFIVNVVQHPFIILYNQGKVL